MPSKTAVEWSKSADESNNFADDTGKTSSSKDNSIPESASPLGTLIDVASFTPSG